MNNNNISLNKKKRAIKIIQYLPILKKLKTIGLIKQNQRINTRNNKICINTDRFTSFWRFILGENRCTNINDVEIIIKDAFNEIDHLLIRIDEDNFKSTHRCACRIIINNLVSCVLDAQIGIDNLKETYKNDASILAHIDVIDSLIESKLNVLEMSQKIKKRKG